MSPRTRTAIGAIALAAAASLARAQATCTAEGFVFDQGGNPVPGVQVLMQYKGHIPQKYRTKTDKKGHFVHVNVWAGRYDLTFSKEGMGEVTMQDWTMRDIVPPEKPPVFRIGAKKEPPAAEGAEPAGLTPEQAAGLVAAELQAANDALAAGRIEEAVAAYQAVIGKAPNLAEAQHNLGLALRKKGDAAGAEAAFRMAAELKPAFAEPHGALSVLLASAGKPADALAEAEKAVALAPDNAQYLYNLAVLQKDQNRSAEAKETFLKLEAVDPTNVELQFHLATVLLGMNQVPDAIARLEKYLAAAPPDAPNVGPARGLVAALKKK
jgi:cytochrome c-type biogenesis protein CcmH/NrfG